MSYKPSKNIVLIGMRGTGKSGVGRAIAEYLDWQFYDVDHVIEAAEGIRISEFVRKHDWEPFRDLESRYTEKLSKLTPAVIATGGGVILRSENIENLKKTGIIVLLHSPLEHLKKRVGAHSHRPSLTGADPAAELEQIWQERSELYEAAADVKVVFDLNTGNKRTDFMRKSKLIIKAVQAHLDRHPRAGGNPDS